MTGPQMYEEGVALLRDAALPQEERETGRPRPALVAEAQAYFLGALVAATAEAGGLASTTSLGPSAWATALKEARP
jgi:hypothetical protein